MSNDGRAEADGSQGATSDDEAAAIERISSTQHAVALREYVVDLLALRPGETALSVGCGPGFEPALLVEGVGDTGCVLGVDVSDDALALAADRCADRPGVEFARGDAVSLPVAAESVDVAIAKQVYRAVSDVDAALAELARVLRPGGRATVVAQDVDALLIHSSDRDRMRRAKTAYRKRIPNPHLGSSLASLAAAAGLSVQRVEPYTTVHTEIDEQVDRGIAVHRRFMEADDAFESQEINAWERDLRDLDAAGAFFSSGTQFCYVLMKPE